MQNKRPVKFNSLSRTLSFSVRLRLFIQVCSLSPDISRVGWWQSLRYAVQTVGERCQSSLNLMRHKRPWMWRENLVPGHSDKLCRSVARDQRCGQSLERTRSMVDTWDTTLEDKRLTVFHGPNGASNNGFPELIRRRWIVETAILPVACKGDRGWLCSLFCHESMKLVLWALPWMLYSPMGADRAGMASVLLQG